MSRISCAVVHVREREIARDGERKRERETENLYLQRKVVGKQHGVCCA